MTFSMQAAGRTQIEENYCSKFTGGQCIVLNNFNFQLFPEFPYIAYFFLKKTYFLPTNAVENSKILTGVVQGFRIWLCPTTIELSHFARSGCIFFASDIYSSFLDKKL